jgi:hypothetical protein
MSRNEEIWQSVIAYFKVKNDLSPAESKDDVAAYGFRAGMAVALLHPEYAQAFVRLLSSPLSPELDELASDDFIRAIPMEEVSDVVPPSQQ